MDISTDIQKFVELRLKKWSNGLEVPILEIEDLPVVLRDPEWVDQAIILKSKNDITGVNRTTARAKMLDLCKKLTPTDSLLPIQHVDRLEKKLFKKCHDLNEYQREFYKISTTLMFQTKYKDFNP